MSFPLSLLNLAGAIALLLWGSHMVQTGVQRAFGPRLNLFLAKALASRPRAFAAGLGVTFILQSSTATGLMTAGLAADGVVGLAPALAVMLGANVGTTLVAQIFSFNAAAFAPALILTGVLSFRRAKNGATRDLGRVAVGLGLMFLALSHLLELMTQYEDQPSLRLMLGAVATEPAVAALLGAALTWAAHSSVASILFIMSLCARGVVPPEAALALTVGANLGAAINPVLEGPSGDDPAARRLPIGNLITRLVGGAIALSLIAPLGRFMVALQPDIGRIAVDFHSLFNLAIALAFFPFLDGYARLLSRLLPKKAEPADPAQPIHLDQGAAENPALALGCAEREALRLADLVDALIGEAREAIDRSDRRLASAARRLGRAINRLAVEIKIYVAALDSEEADDADQRRASDILSFVARIEQGGEVMAGHFLAQVIRHLKRAPSLEPAERDEILAAIDRLRQNLRAASSALMTGDPRIARQLIDEKIAFRDAEAQAAQEEVAALTAAAAPNAAPRRALRLELLRDLKQINSHIVAAAAYPLLEREGELAPSRMMALGA